MNVTIIFETNIEKWISFPVIGPPSFKRIDCGKNKGYDLCLEVDYEDKQDDVLLLNKVTKGTVGVQKDDTVFEGRLLKEGRSVAATIEDPTKPDDIEVVTLYFITIKLNVNRQFP